MARFPNIAAPMMAAFRAGGPGAHTIQSAGILRRLQETFQLTTKGFAPELGATVHPVVIVEDVRDVGALKNPPTRWYLEGTKLAGGAGLNLGAQLYNPVGSGVYVRIHDVRSSMPNVSDVSLGFNDSPFQSAVSKGFSANRAPDPPAVGLPMPKQSIAEVRLHSNVAAFPGATNQATILRGTANGATTWIEDHPITIGEGQGFVIYPFSLNLDFYYRFFWEEIPIARE